MTRVFADTSFYLAMLSRTDNRHKAAVRVAATLDAEVVTTDFVLLELGNALCERRNRSLFVAFTRHLARDSRTEIIEASRELYLAGAKLYSSRRDKDWSLVDCTSFVLMRRMAITSALTADRHFIQAGFDALLCN